METTEWVRERAERLCSELTTWTVGIGPTQWQPVLEAALNDAIARTEERALAAEALKGMQGIRPEVLAFAWLMERELRNNDHKGGWKKDNPCALASRVLEEARELRDALQCTSGMPAFDGTPPRIFRDPASPPVKEQVAEEAADVANMAMMVADVCGCLDLASAQEMQEKAVAEVREKHEDEIKRLREHLTISIEMGAKFVQPGLAAEAKLARLKEPDRALIEAVAHKLRGYYTRKAVEDVIAAIAAYLETPPAEEG